MMRWIGVALLAASLQGCAFGGAGTQTASFGYAPKAASPTGSDLQSRQKSLWERLALTDAKPVLNTTEAVRLVNEYRAEHGLGPVKLHPRLSEAADIHAHDLAQRDRISHFGADGSNPWDRIARTGYKPRLAAENVGTGQSTIKEVFESWKKSPGHNKNLLLADAEHVGVALVYEPRTSYRTFWTLVLGAD